MTAKRAAVPLFAAVADIGRLLMLRTELFFEVFTELVACDAAFGAVLLPLILAGLAYVPAVLAAVPVKAGIAATAAILDDEMISDFLGDCGRIFSEACPDLRKACSVPEGFFDLDSFAEREMGMLCHNGFLLSAPFRYPDGREHYMASTEAKKEQHPKMLPCRQSHGVHSSEPMFAYLNSIEDFAILISARQPRRLELNFAIQLGLTKKSSAQG